MTASYINISRARTQGELKIVGGELDRLEDKLIHLVRDRDDFVGYLRNIDSTHRSLTLKNM